MKGKIFILYFLVFAFSQPGVKAQSQDVSAVAELDTNVIVIGQQTIVKLRLTQPAAISIPWTTIPDTLSKIEIITKGKVDTLPSGDQSKLTREQKFTITAFDSGYFVIPPFAFNYKLPNDTTTYFAETQPQLLTVNIIPVDTTIAIRDIKGPIEVGITWQEILKYSLIGLLVIGITALIVYLTRRKKNVPQIVAPPPPARPAHEIAIEELEKIKEEKLWQQGNFKMYHSRLTDTIRNYISLQWHFDAMEKTTDEIMHSSFSHNLTQTNFLRLKNLLSLADLAKFAKYNPLSIENEQSLSDAFLFVNETKNTGEEKRIESAKAEIKSGNENSNLNQGSPNESV